MGVWVCVGVCARTLEYYSSIKKNGILLFVANWMDLENIMLSEISHRKTNDVGFHLYVESKGKKKQKTKTKNHYLIDTENRLVVTRGRGWQTGKMGEGGQKAQTSHYKIKS